MESSRERGGGLAWYVREEVVFRDSGRTEDEFFRRSQHVDGEGHLILVDLQANPPDEVGKDRGRERHCCELGNGIGEGGEDGRVRRW